MKKILLICSFIGLSLGLSACQTTSHQFNGQSGYKVIEQSNGNAVMTYALSGSTRNDAAKLQNACQQVLGSNKTYQVSVTNTGEIINPVVNPEFGRQIGNSNTKFGLSNTPDLHNTDVSGTNAALEARPATLRLIRFTCS